MPFYFHTLGIRHKRRNRFRLQHARVPLNRGAIGIMYKGQITVAVLPVKIAGALSAAITGVAGQTG